MKKFLLVPILGLWTSVAFSVNVKECYNMNGTEIIAMHESGKFTEYDVITTNAFGEKLAIMRLKKISFKKAGEIFQDVGVRKEGTKTVKLTNGFTQTVDVYVENEECSKLLETDLRANQRPGTD